MTTPVNGRSPRPPAPPKPPPGERSARTVAQSVEVQNAPRGARVTDVVEKPGGGRTVTVEVPAASVRAGASPFAALDRLKTGFVPPPPFAPKTDPFPEPRPAFGAIRPENVAAFTAGAGAEAGGTPRTGGKLEIGGFVAAGATLAASDGPAPFLDVVGFGVAAAGALLVGARNLVELGRDAQVMPSIRKENLEDTPTGVRPDLLPDPGVEQMEKDRARPPGSPTDPTLSDPRASNPPPFPGNGAPVREPPLVTPREPVNPFDFMTVFPPFREDRPLDAPLLPEADGDNTPVDGTPTTPERYEWSPPAAQEPHVRPEMDLALATLLRSPDLSPGQREFLTYLNTPEGQRAFRELAEMSQPWSDNPVQREAFIVEASQKVRKMSLMGLGSESQAELAFVIHGSPETGLRVHPEIRVGSPNSVLNPRAYNDLLADPNVRFVALMHTHPALGPEVINAEGRRVNLGTPVTGFSQGDMQAFHVVRDRQSEMERETGMTPKILGFGNVTTLGGTVTLARFDQDGLIEQRIIGSAGGLLEDAFGMTRLFPEPGLALPPRETSFSRMGAVLREQGYYPDGVPGYERQTRLRE